MIKLCNVTKKYEREAALNNISLTLSSPKIYCLLGRNGAGKTTLLKTIAGHINPSEGLVEVAGQSVSTAKPSHAVHFVGSRASQFNMKLVDLIATASTLQDDFDYEFAMKMLKRFNLNKSKRYKQLSFGMQTMVSTLLNLASNSKIVILDEPVVGFDVIMREQFYDLLSESFENHPRLIIVSTHLIDEIAKVAEELIILDKGKVVLQASINEIDEMAYSLTGMSQIVAPLKDGLHLIAEKTFDGFTSLLVYDKRINPPKDITMKSLSLQEFFVNLVEGNQSI